MQWGNGEMVQRYNSAMVKLVMRDEIIASVTFPFTTTIYQQENS